MSPLPRERLAWAGFWLAIVAPLAYAAIRIAERASRGGLGDPLLAVSEPYRAYFWRAAVAAFAGVAAAVVAAFARGTPSPRVAVLGAGAVFVAFVAAAFAVP